MERRLKDAGIPVNPEEFGVSDDVFYVVNTLVHELDKARIFGPLTREELETKRQIYRTFMSEQLPGVADRHPFVVYRMTRIE